LVALPPGLVIILEEKRPNRLRSVARCSILPRCFRDLSSLLSVLCFWLAALKRRLCAAAGVRLSRLFPCESAFSRRKSGRNSTSASATGCQSRSFVGPHIWARTTPFAAAWAIKGYELAPIRSLADHFDAKCYKATWLVKFLSLLRTPAHPLSASAPASGPCQFWSQPGQRW